MARSVPSQVCSTFAPDSWALEEFVVSARWCVGKAATGTMDGGDRSDMGADGMTETVFSEPSECTGGDGVVRRSPQLEALLAALAETAGPRLPDPFEKVVVAASGDVAPGEQLPVIVPSPTLLSPTLPPPSRSRVEMLLAVASAPFEVTQGEDGAVTLVCRSGFEIAENILSALESPGALEDLVELVRARGVLSGS